MTRFRTLLFGLTLVAGTAAITTVVVSQEKARDDDPWSKYSVPGKEHDVLNRLAGKWEFQVTARLTPGAEPLEARITADYRWLFGGRFLLGELEGYVAGELFRAKELLGFDRFRQEYNSLWVDNKTTAVQLATGHYDQRKGELVLEGVQDDVDQNVRDQKFKIVYRFVEDDKLVMEIFREQADGTMHRRVEVAGKRID